MSARPSSRSLLSVAPLAPFHFSHEQFLSPVFPLSIVVPLPRLSFFLAPSPFSALSSPLFATNTRFQLSRAKNRVIYRNGIYAMHHRHACTSARVRYARARARASMLGSPQISRGSRPRRNGTALLSAARVSVSQVRPTSEGAIPRGSTSYCLLGRSIILQ